MLARLGGFATSSAIAGLSAILVVPLLVHGVGPGRWAGVAVGQSVGAIAAIVLGLGWGVSGAATVASRPETARDYLFESMVTRAVILTPIVLAAAGVAYAAAPAEHIPAALTAIAFAAVGLGSNWFYIGSGRPDRLLAFETLPRSIGQLCGAALVASGLPLELYPLLALGGCVTAASLTTRFASSRRLKQPLRRTVGSTIRSQGHAAVTGIVSASYINLPTIAVAVLAPAQTPVIALADRLFTFANAGLAPINQTLQGWIPHPDPELQRQRIRQGTRIAAIVALTAGGGLALVQGPAGFLLVGGRFALPGAISLAYGATLAFTTLSQTVGVACLASLGAIRAVAASAVAGAVFGLALLIPATLALGAVGAASGESIAEFVVVVVQLAVLRRVLRAHDSDVRIAT